jgi:hypothetical protein
VPVRGVKDYQLSQIGVTRVKKRKIRRQQRDERSLALMSQAVQKKTDVGMSALMRLSFPTKSVSDAVDTGFTAVELEPQSLLITPAPSERLTIL